MKISSLAWKGILRNPAPYVFTKNMHWTAMAVNSTTKHWDQNCGEVVMHRKTSKDMFWEELLKNDKIMMKYQK